LEKVSGRPHQRTFKVKVKIEGCRNVGLGRGTTLKEAQMEAAKNLVEKLQNGRNRLVRETARKIHSRFIAQF
ncbi:MAG: putative dsRNA-binding protein, partial [Candidatus Omnitrophica bacterium]|nr:putative dsRNA-binding protein [Candidatus Omnitrophota bacterium]